ncbi:thiamine diphosphokinase [Facklamia miroungae]|uniref:Thiamine diphosphokinase n=1 Tax=Facklamia miroungae TaxID=120956 RepID=A0A1G7PQV4_9LACT|nr:thiamine diphosphokinase [Facklamia miroungae]NKZ28795.1 thiamine diphosphokinase [Facklamia miroungae]SDF88623.1 thiamine pyrophosphokinase [Facklamia miroungae]
MFDKIIICAGAPHPALNYLDLPSDRICLIGVDGGAWQLVEAGYRLNFAVGDFDSVNQDQLAQIESASQEVLKYPAAKDDTDMEIGLELALSQDERCPIEVYGAIGHGVGRLDHLIGNLWLVYQERFRSLIPRLIFIEFDQMIRFFIPGNHSLENINDCHYLSIISMTPTKSLRIAGAKYNLEPTDFTLPRALVSNEFMDHHPISLSFREGLIMVIWEKGK